ncbi:hypothetical protein ACP275_12G048600 [Erythranthe tilingii]
MEENMENILVCTRVMVKMKPGETAGECFRRLENSGNGYSYEDHMNFMALGIERPIDGLSSCNEWKLDHIGDMVEEFAYNLRPFVDGKDEYAIWLGLKNTASLLTKLPNEDVTLRQCTQPVRVPRRITDYDREHFPHNAKIKMLCNQVSRYYYVDLMDLDFNGVAVNVTTFANLLEAAMMSRAGAGDGDDDGEGSGD